MNVTTTHELAIDTPQMEFEVVRETRTYLVFTRDDMAYIVASSNSERNALLIAVGVHDLYDDPWAACVAHRDGAVEVIGTDAELRLRVLEYVKSHPETAARLRQG